MMPKVALQLIAYRHDGSLEDLDRAFASFEQVQYPREAWKIVIIDNPSKQGRSAEHLAATWLPKVGDTLPEVEIVHSEENSGFAGGHLQGYEASKRWGADYVYLLNQDAALDPEALQAAVKRMQADRAIAVLQSEIRLAQAPDTLNSLGNCLQYLGFGFSDGYKQPVQATSALPHFYASGAGVLLRVEHVDAIGGIFDPFFFMYHEDVDISWRARLAGLKVEVERASIVYHRYEFSRSIQKFYWMERNRHLVNLAHYRWPTLLLLAPVFAVMELGTFLFALRSGWAAAKVKSWLAFLTSPVWVWIWERRNLIRRIRTVSDRQLMDAMVGSITSQEVENGITRHVVNPVLEAYFKIVKTLVRW